MDTGFNIFEQQPILQSAPAPAPRRRWRKVLLASAAVLGLAGAGGAFLLSPYNHLILMPAGDPSTQVRPPAAESNGPAVVAPAARLAGVPHQDAKPARRDTVAPTDPDAQTREILGLRGGSDKQPAATTAGRADTAGGQPEKPVILPSTKPPGPAAPPAALATTEVGAPPVQRPASPTPLAIGAAPSPLGSAAMEPGMTAPASPPASPAAPAPLAPQPSTTAVDPAREAEAADKTDTRPQNQGAADAAQPVAPVLLAASGSGPSPPTPTNTAAPTPASADAVAIAIALAPKPMVRGEQIEVLHLVSQLGTAIRDLRAENAGLRASTKASSDKVDTAVADFERRLALAESRVAIKGAMADMDAPPEAIAPVPPAPPAPRTARSSGKAAPQLASPQTQASAPAAPGPQRFKVQAASPGLAMLSELDRSGGEGSQREVKVGDQVPGFGRVVTIAQQGVAWVVKTEHGTIQ